MSHPYPRHLLISNQNKFKAEVKNPIDYNSVNINDIIEQYQILKKNSGKQITEAINKYLVIKKTTTEHSGTFFDLLDLNENNENPIIIKGVSLRHYNLRKYFDANK